MCLLISPNMTLPMKKKGARENGEKNSAAELQLKIGY